MNIFKNLINSLLAKDVATPAIPGAMGKLLAQMGITEIGPRQVSGTPISVLMGCKKELVLIPGATSLAYTREGKPVLAKNKHGRTYHVMDNYAVTRKQWKQMQNDQRRKEAGRWYSGAEAA